MLLALASRAIGGHNLADHDPYADKDRANHGVEPFEGHHKKTCAFRNCFLSASSLRVTSRGRDPGLTLFPLRFRQLPPPGWANDLRRLSDWRRNFLSTADGLLPRGQELDLAAGNLESIEIRML